GRRILPDGLDAGEDRPQAAEDRVRGRERRREPASPAPPPAPPARSPLAGAAVVEVPIALVREHAQLELELLPHEPAQAQDGQDAVVGGRRQPGAREFELRLEGFPGRMHALAVAAGDGPPWRVVDLPEDPVHLAEELAQPPQGFFVGEVFRHVREPSAAPRLPHGGNDGGGEALLQLARPRRAPPAARAPRPAAAGGADSAAR